jgi:hypothetical protein
MESDADDPDRGNAAATVGPRICTAENGYYRPHGKAQDVFSGFKLRAVFGPLRGEETPLSQVAVERTHLRSRSSPIDQDPKLRPGEQGGYI